MQALTRLLKRDPGQHFERRHEGHLPELADVPGGFARIRAAPISGTGSGTGPAARRRGPEVARTAGEGIAAASRGAGNGREPAGGRGICGVCSRRRRTCTPDGCPPAVGCEEPPAARNEWIAQPCARALPDGVEGSIGAERSRGVCSGSASSGGSGSERVEVYAASRRGRIGRTVVPAPAVPESRGRGILAIRSFLGYDR